MAFKKATRTQGKIRLGLCGPSGSGKTYTALRIASGMCAPGKRIALVDSERGSASLYAGKFDFDVNELPNFKVETYLAALREAEKAGYEVVILDSISHAWAGKGGLLEQVDDAAQRERGNKFAAWRHVTPQHHEFVEAMLTSPCHIIATMRSKTEWVLETNEKGKQVPRKVGMAPVQRDGMEYEFTIVGDLDGAVLSISKTRLDDVVPQQAIIRQPGEELGRKLAEWLRGGAPAPVAPTPPAAPPAAPAAPSAAEPPPAPPAPPSEEVVHRAKGLISEAVKKNDAAKVKEILDRAAHAKNPPTPEQLEELRDYAQIEMRTPYGEILVANAAAGQLPITAKTWLEGNGVTSNCPKKVTPEMAAAFAEHLRGLAEPGSTG